MTTTQIRDMDGQRSLTIDHQGSSTYLDGGGVCMEFDTGLFIAAIQRAFEAKNACGSCVASLALTS